MSGNQTLYAGVTQTFDVTFILMPVDTTTNPPKATIYTDLARTVVAVARASMTATANPNVWLTTVPSTLAAGNYYLKFEAVYTVGQGYVADSNDTLTMLTATVNLGSSLVQVSDVRSSQSDTTNSPLAYLWRNLTDAQLLTHLTRASRRAEQIVGTRLSSFTVTEDVTLYWEKGFDPYASICWVSYAPPDQSEDWVGSVSQVRLLDPSSSPPTLTTVTGSTDFVASTGTVRFSRAPSYLATQARITYTGGYSTVPEDLVEATIMLAAHAFVVGVDARDGQMDGQDLYGEAYGILKNWASMVAPGIA